MPLFIVIKLLGILDHEEIEEDLTLSTANNSHCFNISITDDTLPEENEYFELTLTNIIRRQYNYSVYQVHTPVVTVTILDNDGNLN